MKQIRSPFQKVSFVLFLIVFGVVMAFPLLYLFFCSFMTEKQLNTIPPSLIPNVWTLENFKQAFIQQPLILYIVNSFIVTLLVVGICTVLGCMASYALTRTEIKLKKVFLVFVLTISLLPTITIINPIYQVYSKLGWLNSYWGLAIIVAVTNLPMSIWFLTAIFKNIPVSIEESAEIDGANIWQLFVKILLPMLKAGIFSVNILTFIDAWNTYLLSQVLNQFQTHRTVVVGLSLYQTTYSLPFGTIAAAALVTIVPIILMVLCFQRNILGGIFDGSIKG
jgi:multiple sugar transport system permease protein